MSPDPAYRVRSRHVTHERLDDEVIAIDLERGYYFAMVGPAADIWSALIGGADTGVAAALLAERYGIQPAVARSAVDGFVVRLLDHNLLLERDDIIGGELGIPVLPDLPGPAQWADPELEHYDDMADLVLLDPIHQVDESGWPHLPPES